MRNLRDSFDMQDKRIHLNNAGMGPLTQAARDRMIELVHFQAREGSDLFPGLLADLNSARSTWANFVGTTPVRLAMTSNFATAISMVAWGLVFKPTDRILTTDQEYPSNAYIWNLVAKEKNLGLIAHPSRADTSIDWNAFIAQIQPGVRVVTLSWVQYRSGVVAPLKLISAACQKVGALLIVDVIQGLGVLPFDIKAEGVDIACGGAHKWTCGITGQGFIAFRDDIYQQMRPIIQGAMTYGTPDDPVDFKRPALATAARFEPGTLGHFAILANAESLRVLKDAGPEQTLKTALALTKTLAVGLHEMGCTVLGEPVDAKQSPIVTFQTKVGIEKVSERLTQSKISHTLRNESIRLSPHGFNTAEEIEFTLKVIKVARTL